MEHVECVFCQCIHPCWKVPLFLVIEEELIVQNENHKIKIYEGDEQFGKHIPPAILFHAIQLFNGQALKSAWNF